MTVKESISYFSNLAKEIETKVDLEKYVYIIYDTEYFKNTVSSDVANFQRVYWEEILQRAHWAGLSSLLRNIQWLKGVSLAIQKNDLLLFTANLRCLIESSGDNLLSLLNVPATLADNYSNISKCLRGENGEKTLHVSKELEEILIHFSYARKITEEEKRLQGKIPKYQNAKPASEYLKWLDNKIDNGPIANLYSILCQFAHPAAHSIQYLFQTTFDNEKYKFIYSKNADSNYIEWILKEYDNEIIKSLQCGFNPGLFTLKTLNYFDYELTKTPYVDQINFEIKYWLDIKQKIEQK
jgi:hypothetical protein